MRAPRIVWPGYPHHITLRGNNRRCLFSFPRDYRQLLFFINQALDMEACAIHALMLMRNHIHLAVTPQKAEDLSCFVKCFAQRYAMYRNRQRNSSGKLFEERYHSRPIEDDIDLEAVMTYIELNPVRANIVKDPTEYPWSTVRLHLGMFDDLEVHPDMWTPTAWFLSLGNSARSRAARYRQCLDAALRHDQPQPTKVLRAEAQSTNTTDEWIRRPDDSRARDETCRYTYLPTGLERSPDKR